MTRRFEFVGGSSAKFYEVEVAGKEINVTYGRIGTDGQAQRKSFANTTAAQQHGDKVIQQKLAKGYVEQTAT